MGVVKSRSTATVQNRLPHNKVITMEGVHDSFRLHVVQEEKDIHEAKHLAGSFHQSQSEHHCDVEFYGIDEDSTEEASINFDEDIFDPLFCYEGEGDAPSLFKSINFHADQSNNASVLTFTSCTSSASLDISALKPQSTLTRGPVKNEDSAHQDFSSDNDKHGHFSQSISSLRGTLQKNPRDTFVKSERAARRHTTGVSALPDSNSSQSCNESARRHTVATLPAKLSESSSALTLTSASQRRSSRTVTRRSGLMRPGSNNVVSQQRDLSTELPPPMTLLRRNRTAPGVTDSSLLSTPEQKTCSSTVSSIITPGTTYSNSSGRISRRRRLSLLNLKTPSLLDDDGDGIIMEEKNDSLQLKQATQQVVGTKNSNDNFQGRVNHAFLLNGIDSSANRNEEVPVEQHVCNNSQHATNKPIRPQRCSIGSTSDQTTIATTDITTTEDDSSSRTNELKKVEVSECLSVRSGQSSDQKSLSNAITTSSVAEKDITKPSHDDMGKNSHKRRSHQHSSTKTSINSMSNDADKEVRYKVHDESAMPSEPRKGVTLTLSLLKSLPRSVDKAPSSLSLVPLFPFEDVQCKGRCRSTVDTMTDDVVSDISSKGQDAPDLPCKCRKRIIPTPPPKPLSRIAQESLLTSSLEPDSSHKFMQRSERRRSTKTSTVRTKSEVDDRGTAMDVGMDKSERNMKPKEKQSSTRKRECERRLGGSCSSAQTHQTSVLAQKDCDKKSKLATDSKLFNSEQNGFRDRNLSKSTKSTKSLSSRARKNDPVLSSRDQFQKMRSANLTTNKGHVMQKISYAELEKWVSND